jgi:hypothetical protein
MRASLRRGEQISARDRTWKSNCEPTTACRKVSPPAEVLGPELLVLARVSYGALSGLQICRAAFPGGPICDLSRPPRSLALCQVPPLAEIGLAFRRAPFVLSTCGLVPARRCRLGLKATGVTRSAFESTNKPAALSLGAHDAARIADCQTV